MIWFQEWPLYRNGPGDTQKTVQASAQSLVITLLDISAAVDTVANHILLSILSGMGITWQWIFPV